VSTLVLSPHPDDAVFSCWHVLVGEADVRVLTIFAGVPAEGLEPPRWDRITGGRDPVTRVRERREEDRRALALAGRVPDFLDFVERQYSGSLPRVDDVLRAIPDADEIFAPAGIGGHSAHELVREAGLQLLKAGADVSFYADLPYATEFGWPAWVTGSELEPFRDVDAYWALHVEPLVLAGCSAQVVELDEAEQRRKIEAMRAYRTQFPALEAGSQRRLTHPELVRYEVVFAREG
jgi:LmbE family N-acetylglucosaminyl deacetylase